MSGCSTSAFRRALVLGQRGDGRAGSGRSPTRPPAGGRRARPTPCTTPENVIAPACAQTRSSPVGSGIRHAPKRVVALEGGERAQPAVLLGGDGDEHDVAVRRAPARAPPARAARRRRRPSCRRCRAPTRSPRRCAPTTGRRATAPCPRGRRRRGRRGPAAARPGPTRARSPPGPTARPAAPPRPGGRGRRAARRGRGGAGRRAARAPRRSSARRSSTARSSPVTLGTWTSAAMSRASAAASTRPSAAASVTGGELARPCGDRRPDGGDLRAPCTPLVSART